MQDIANLSWNQWNQQRKFPLRYDCSGVSSDSLFQIPDDLMIGLSLTFALSQRFVDPSLFFISKISWYDPGLSVEISYVSSSETTETVAEIVVFLDSEEKFPEKPVLIQSVSSEEITGFLLFGSEGGLKSQPLGLWEFNAQTASLDPFCVRMLPSSVSSLYVQSGNNVLGPFYGEIHLQQGDGITLTAESGDSTILSPSIYPEGYGTVVTLSQTVCSDLDGNEGENAAVPIYTINGVPPDSEGHFLLESRSCLSIEPHSSSQHTLVLDDRCAEPCCTCSDLTPILAKIEEFTETLQQLEKSLDVVSFQTELLFQTRSELS
jgi:hypothetical protein